MAEPELLSDSRRAQHGQQQQTRGQQATLEQPTLEQRQQQPRGKQHHHAQFEESHTPRNAAAAASEAALPAVHTHHGTSAKASGRVHVHHADHVDDFPMGSPIAPWCGLPTETTGAIGDDRQAYGRSDSLASAVSVQDFSQAAPSEHMQHRCLEQQQQQRQCEDRGASPILVLQGGHANPDTSDATAEAQEQHASAPAARKTQQQHKQSTPQQQQKQPSVPQPWTKAQSPSPQGVTAALISHSTTAQDTGDMPAWHVGVAQLRHLGLSRLPHDVRPSNPSSITEDWPVSGTNAKHAKHTEAALFSGVRDSSSHVYHETHSRDSRGVVKAGGGSAPLEEKRLRQGAAVAGGVIPVQWDGPSQDPSPARPPQTNGARSPEEASRHRGHDGNRIAGCKNDGIRFPEQAADYEGRDQERSAGGGATDRQTGRHSDGGVSGQFHLHLEATISDSLVSSLYPKPYIRTQPSSPSRDTVACVHRACLTVTLNSSIVLNSMVRLNDTDGHAHLLR